MKIAYFKKKFIPLNKAKIPITNRGFMYGDGVFETMRAYNGVVFCLEKHIERLFKSLKALHIRLPIAKTKIRKIIYQLLHKNRLKNAYIKIIVTRESTIAIYVLPHKGIPEKTYKTGIKAIISDSRLNEKSGLAGHKTLNYLHNMLCRHEAEKKGTREAILLNTKGFVSEAASSNIFIVKGRKLMTPPLECGCLPGITRHEVIRLAKKLLNVSESRIRTHTLESADEVFLTNSLAEIMPIVKIGKRSIGKGRPGPLTMKLREHLKGAVRDYCAREKAK